NIDKIRTERNNLRAEIVHLKDQMQGEFLAQNTAKIRLGELDEKNGSTMQDYRNIQTETGEIERQLEEIKDSRSREEVELEQSQKTEKDTELLIGQKQKELEEKREIRRGRMAGTEQI